MTTPLEKWVDEQAKLTEPDKIHWCDGSEAEAEKLIETGLTEEKLADKFVFHELNQKTFPLCFLHRSHANDVARTEQKTFVCHENKELAGPNNNWMEPKESKEKMQKLFKSCMRGRTMYVMPYMMGHPDSPYAKACVQITDTSYVAVNMRIMTRMSKHIVEKIGKSDSFVKGLHSTGDLDPDRRFIMHYPNDHLVESFGSGYGGNALLGKKCFSLRIASWLGFQEGWLAEHMIIIGIEDPKGNVAYIAAAMPSACGKTNLAMMQSALPGYKIWTVGDDIAWLNVGEDGRLYAINPETGLFGVAPGTSAKTNPNMVTALKAGKFFPTLFTNTALNVDTNEPWWEGADGEMPKNIVDWQENKWDASMGTKAAHPNSRFTVSIYQCSTLSKEFNNPKGVPISAIIFGGKRSSLIPLVYESFNWEHGVFLGSMMGSETTSAAMHKAGVLRRDPMAMLPFCGYNMGDYFKHWLDVGKKGKKLPKIFFVNWFRLDDNEKFLWPGFGENIRVLKWIIERAKGDAKARETPIGFVPDLSDFELGGLTVSKSNMEKLFNVDMKEWTEELKNIKDYYKIFEDRIPEEIWKQFNKIANC